MATVIFTLGVNTFTFSKARKFPVHDPVQVNVPTDMTDGGQMYCYNKGIEEKLYNLVYEKLPAIDFTNFENWLKTIAIGPVNTFTMTDENGATHTVRLINTQNPLQADGENSSGWLYSGTIQLREEI